MYTEQLLRYHQLRDSNRLFWVEDEGTGPSNFPYDQKALLSLSILENAVEHKRNSARLFVKNVSNLKSLQQSILDLIDAELAERGMGAEN